MSRLRHQQGIAALVLLIALPLACARSSEERGLEAQEQSVAPAEAELSPEPAPRGLAELQAELQANEADLRQLGVAIPLAGLVDGGDGEQASEAPATVTGTPTDQPDMGGASPGPSATKTSAKERKGKAATHKPSKSDTRSPSVQPSGGGRGAGDLELDDDIGKAEAPAKDAEGEPTPEPAKAVQGPPIVEPKPQVEDRCPMICSLSEGTCGLAEEICSLSDRHPDDDDYGRACERANTDCELAKEACLECLG